MPKLIIMRPDSAAEDIDLDTDSVTIGRAPENSVTLDEIACSRRHCQILRISSGYEITDLKSRNGTKVNGVKRERHVLADGDIIEIGAVRITYRERSGSEEDVVLEDMVADSGAGGSECHLVYSGGPLDGRKIPLATDRTTFGRKDSNAVVMKDAMVSSYHCEITREDGGYVLRDLGSTNGSVVNGDPVSEMALNHGSRISLGKTRFIFVDPAVADYEQALEAEGDADADWGMMRAQVDMGRVKRARRARIVWTLVFVAIIGGGAAFLMLNPEVMKEFMQTETVAAVEPVPGNQIDFDEFSFESGRSWAVPEGSLGSSTVTPGPAHQGESSLQVIGDREGFVPTAAFAPEPFTVVGGRTYQFSAWVRLNLPETAAAAAIIWMKPEGPEVERISATAWGKDGDWNQVRMNVTPPEGADQAKLALMVMGAGSARFDDVVFKVVAGAPDRPVEEIESGGSLIRIGDMGEISVERTGQLLLWNGGFVGLTEDDRLTSQELCFRPDSVKHSVEGSKLSGSLLVPGGKTVRLSMEIVPQPDRIRIICRVDKIVPGVSAVGLGFMVSGDYVSEGATLSGDEGARAVHSETDERGVRKLILGGAGKRLSLVSAEPARLRVFSGRALRMAFLLPVGTEEAVFELVTDFTEERRAARDLLSSARQSKATGRMGEAMISYARVVNEFPFDAGTRLQARNELAVIAREGQIRLGRAQVLYDGAKDFYDVADLTEALQLAEGVVLDYEGFKLLADKAGELAALARGVLDEIEQARDELTAERLEKQAADCEARNEIHLAEAFRKAAASIKGK